MRQTCRYCHGTRMHIKFPCNECEGKGQTVQRKTVTVPVPAGMYYMCFSLQSKLFTYSKYLRVEFLISRGSLCECGDTLLTGFLF